MWQSLSLDDSLPGISPSIRQGSKCKSSSSTLSDVHTKRNKYHLPWQSIDSSPRHSSRSIWRHSDSRTDLSRFDLLSFVCVRRERSACLSVHFRSGMFIASHLRECTCCVYQYCHSRNPCIYLSVSSLSPWHGSEQSCADEHTSSFHIAFSFRSVHSPSSCATFRRSLRDR